ncbi:MAG: TonB-dependent receptor [Bacteroidales bacterium]
MKRIQLLIFLICFGFVSTMQAQTTQKLYSIKGVIYEHGTNTPIEMAFVTLPDLNLWGTTNSKGEFTINRVAGGETKVEVTCLGYQTVSMVVNITKDVTNLTFKLKEENLKMESVTVTAQEVRSAVNTSTKMERQAIDHLQVINPTDIMSLMPGGRTVNPNLMTQSIFSVRGGDGNGSFGTAVEVDGVRLSSNANISNTTGIDTRNLATSNIESIEVITGVPSVEYGDMTSGMVIIQTKKGRTPFNLNVSLNPTTKQVSLSKGFDLQKERGILNINAEYAHAFSNPVSPYTTYFRNGYGVNYSNTFNRTGKPIQLNVNLGGTLGRQDAKTDPDAYRDTYTSKEDNALRFGTGLNWLVNSNWLTNLSLNLSASYKDDYQEVNDYYSYATIKPAVNSMENGYFETNYLPPQFYNLKMVDSKTLSARANLKANLNKKYGEVLNKIKAGIGWNTSGNIGAGEDYQLDLYPDGYRPRPYTDIPFIHNINAYLEDNLTLPIGKTSLTLIGGVRVERTVIKDMAYEKAISASPRFNGRYTLVDKRRSKDLIRHLSVRGGWGIMEKLPSLNTLFPMDKYRDIVVYSKNYTFHGEPNQYFYAANTKVFRDFFNPKLEWSRSRNIEVGLDANIRGVDISVVYFNNKALNPYITETFHEKYEYRKTDETHELPLDPIFKIEPQSGDIYVRPELDPNGWEIIPKSVEDAIFIPNAMQANGEPSTRQGVELTINFGKIDAIRTSFRLDAQYSHTKAISERINSSYASGPHSTLPVGDQRSYEFLAFYLGGTGRNVTYNGEWRDGMTANFTATTHIPEIRMTVSLRVEGTIFNRSQVLTTRDGEEWAYLVGEDGRTPIPGTVYGQKDHYTGVWPVEYMGLDGVRHPFTQAEFDDPRFAKMIGRSNTTYRYALDGNWSYFFANISLTKELGDHASLSFNVNNFTKSNPFIRSWQTEISTSRGISFAYGATLRIKF